MGYIKMCRNALCGVIASCDLHDFETEKRTTIETRQKIKREIQNREEQIKILLTQKVRDMALVSGAEHLIEETYDSIQRNLLAQLHLSLIHI